ncbi:MMPL family transporter [Lentimicrobium sp. L6]|uniref:efflux RND transporter permease subunit n=1 Tax=Lentimicrobium sp. L6 TaxID=2735916 RepID=UPI001557C301|nr:MMPL family transporter [Lentimicrobium sp. L6]NPD83738.1 MMPL family transporter [Lentimicrobium sp. L6]
MWKYIVRGILRYRFYNLLVIGLITAFMVFMATQNKMSYKLAQMLPSDHPIMQDYDGFKERFGQDGAVMFIGAQLDDIYQLNRFNSWYDLTKQLSEVEGVEGVLSVTNIYTLTKNREEKKFDFDPVLKKRPESQQELDSLAQIIQGLKFYEGLLYNPDSQVQMMMITLDKEILNTKERVPLIYDIKDILDSFGMEHDLEMHYSGLPYIRTITSDLVKRELNLFIFLALLVAAIILTIFFKNFQSVFFPILIVIIATIWTLGSIALMGYEITILTGIIPPLLIVIGIENSIFLLNKYQTEYKAHQNKVKALSRMVTRIGSANFLTNATTAAGFAAFIVTGNKLLVEFGIIASINILGIYILTLVLIPVFFSYSKPPKFKRLDKIDSGPTSIILDKMVFLVSNYRTRTYWISIIIVVAGFVGVSQLKTTGSIVDDIPHEDVLYTDLMFFEEHFNGVMPLEITVDTRMKRGVLKLSFIKRLDKLSTKVLGQYTELSKPLSVADLVKFSKQGFYNGNPKKYSIPSNQEANFIMQYMPKMEGGQKGLINSFVDEDLQVTRVTVQMANLGTKEIESLKDSLVPQIEAIFPSDKYDVKVTGTSVVFLEGTKYLVKNLFQSLLLALFVIALLMALLFSSARMVVISLIPNLIPQLLTAAMMGYFGIPIKPSTILIFSIALGISVDNTIHFLSRYRLHLKMNNWQISKSVILALRETGYSMINSSIVLFFGFFIFTFSQFGGTKSMGYLISFTLFVALLSNLFLLPSLLLTLDKRMTTKQFKEPLLEALDEKNEEDIEESKLNKYNK